MFRGFAVSRSVAWRTGFHPRSHRPDRETAKRRPCTHPGAEMELNPLPARFLADLPRDLQQQGFKLLRGDGLGEVIIEPRIAAVADVSSMPYPLRAMPRRWRSVLSNRIRSRPLPSGSPRSLMTRSNGSPAAAFRASAAQPAPCHVVPQAAQESSGRPLRVDVIFHQQDPQPVRPAADGARGRLARRGRRLRCGLRA